MLSNTISKTFITFVPDCKELNCLGYYFNIIIRWVNIIFTGYEARTFFLKIFLFYLRKFFGQITEAFDYKSEEHYNHRLNMELNLQSLFGLLCTAVLVGWDSETPPLPPRLGSYTRGLLISKDRRHLFVTPWLHWRANAYYPIVYLSVHQRAKELVTLSLYYNLYVIGTQTCCAS